MSDTPLTPNRRQRDAEARRALLAMFQERWPAAFPCDFRHLKPLAIGIHHDLMAALPETPGPLIRQTIALWQRWTGPRYWLAVRKGGPRYDLEGNPRGEVTPEEQERAKQDRTAFSERRRVGKHRAAPQAGAARPGVTPPASEAE